MDRAVHSRNVLDVDRHLVHDGDTVGGGGGVLDDAIDRDGDRAADGAVYVVRDGPRDGDCLVDRDVHGVRAVDNVRVGDRDRDGDVHHLLDRDGSVDVADRAGDGDGHGHRYGARERDLDWDVVRDDAGDGAVVRHLAFARDGLLDADGDGHVALDDLLDVDRVGNLLLDDALYGVWARARDGDAHLEGDRALDELLNGEGAINDLDDGDLDADRVGDSVWDRAVEGVVLRDVLGHGDGFLDNVLNRERTVNLVLNNLLVNLLANRDTDTFSARAGRVLCVNKPVSMIVMLNANMLVMMLVHVWRRMHMMMMVMMTYSVRMSMPMGVVIVPGLMNRHSDSY